MFAFASFSSPSDGYAVTRTAELRRVLALPRRSWSDEEAALLAEQLTSVLRTPAGTMALRPMQAVALAEIGMLGGLFGILRVGAGKTLVSLLAPVVGEATRPALIIPAKLVGKTRRDLRALCEHWDIPEPAIITYEWLGRAQAADALDRLAPDFIVADEAHKLKNKKAACTRRVARYLKNSGAKFVAMSGTITKRSLHDYQHMIRWSLGDAGAPLPTNWGDLEAWADALDERKNMLRRAHPGALVELCDDAERRVFDADAKLGARVAYRRRLIETPGVVATQETDVDASIVITAVEPRPSAAIDAAFAGMRARWELPDGEPIDDALSMHRHARELALGFFYRWEPSPPRAWLDARREWCAFVRSTLAFSRTLDSMKQVADRFPEARELQAWRAVRDTFKPNTVPVWIDDTALVQAEAWLENEGGLLWTEHKCFAEELARRTGIPYFGQGNASDAEKRAPGEPMILSVEACREGLNLQTHWSTNFLVSPPPNGERWEQLLGRTHRDGQTADEVTVDVACFSMEHAESFFQARSDAEYVAASTGSPQKLLVADHDFASLDEYGTRRGARWNK